MEPQDIIVAPPPAALTELTVLADEARAYAADARASNTRRAYASDWHHFSAWCAARQLTDLPAAPATVALYLADLARDHKVSTIDRRRVAISQAHQIAGYDPPTRDRLVRETVTGIKRQHGTAQEGKAPAETEVIRRMVETCDESLLGLRNRAILLVGFAGAFRRSELVSLTMADLRFVRDGAVLTLRRSKTDQEGQGTEKAIPYGSHPDTCPVRALRDWLDQAGITSGAIFRSFRAGRLQTHAASDRTVAEVVKAAAEAAGLDPALYSGHSLRAGLATSAAAAGVEERVIMKQTGHRSERMVRKYIREGNLFRENAAAKVGL